MAMAALGMHIVVLANHKTNGRVTCRSTWPALGTHLTPSHAPPYAAAVTHSDVFAFGVLLYEMAVGCKAFAEYQPAQILVGRITGDLELHWPAEAPAEVRALAERCMQLDPDVRPSFREVVEELRRQVRVCVCVCV